MTCIRSRTGREFGASFTTCAKAGPAVQAFQHAATWAGMPAVGSGAAGAAGAKPATQRHDNTKGDQGEDGPMHISW